MRNSPRFSLTRERHITAVEQNQYRVGRREGSDLRRALTANVCKRGISCFSGWTTPPSTAFHIYIRIELNVYGRRSTGIT
jgi:hypothetical protein